jgi:hypothetical protein
MGVLVDRKGVISLSLATGDPNESIDTIRERKFTLRVRRR